MYVYMYVHMYIFMYVYRYTYTSPWSYVKLAKSASLLNKSHSESHSLSESRSIRYSSQSSEY